MEPEDIEYSNTRAAAEHLPVARRRSPKAKTLIAFSALIMLLFCVFVAYQASKAYENSIADGKANASRLTHILSDQVDLTLLGSTLCSTVQSSGSISTPCSAATCRTISKITSPLGR